MNAAANRMGSWVASQVGATPKPDVTFIKSVRIRARDRWISFRVEAGALELATAAAVFVFGQALGEGLRQVVQQI